MNCAQPPQRPLQWLHIHAYTQTHCATTPHSTCPGNTHTYRPPNTIYNATAPVHTPQQLANKQQTMQPTNQPTNQPNSAVQEPIHQQPTNEPNNQPSYPKTNSQPTNKPGTTAHGGGGVCITREDGGQSIPRTNIAQLLTLQQYTRQPHTRNTHGREEGRRNTPTSWCHCVPTSSPQSKKPAHLQRGNGYPP